MNSYTLLLLTQVNNQYILYYFFFISFFLNLNILYFYWDCLKPYNIFNKAQTLVRSNEILKRSQVFYFNIPVYNFIRFQFCLVKLEINQIARCCRYRQSAGITIQWVDLNYFPDSSHFNQYNPVQTVITFNQPFKATRWHIDMCMYKYSGWNNR